jgi:HK97 family phage portal protein
MLERFFARSEQRAISFQTIWGSGGDIELASKSGTRVNSDTAFQVNAIFAVISLISDTVATLPVDSFIASDGVRRPFRPRPSWVLKPDVDTTKEAFYGACIVSLLLEGNAFIRVFSNPQGEIVNMSVLNPLDVEIKRNGIGRVMFQVRGEEKLLSSEEVLFIPDVVRPGHIRGVSRVEALKENFGLAIALENYAATFFGKGNQTSGIIEFPEMLTGEEARALADGFDARHRGWSRAHKTGVLSGGARYVPTSVENDKAQFLDSRRMAVEDIARAFNVPPHLLGLPGTNTYASVEQNNLAFVTHTLRPIVQKLESSFGSLMSRYPGGEQAFIRFNLDGLLRADVESRHNSYSTGLQAGYYTINDVRRFEDLRPIEDQAANNVRVPLANVDITSAEVAEQQERVNMAAQLIQVGFDPAATLAAFELPQIAHTGIPTVQLQAGAAEEVEAVKEAYGAEG